LIQPEADEQRECERDHGADYGLGRRSSRAEDAREEGHELTVAHLKLLHRRLSDLTFCAGFQTAPSPACGV
jgi:hypothetical protein